MSDGVISDDDIDRFKKFWASDRTGKSIARELGVGVSTLYETARRLDLPTRAQYRKLLQPKLTAVPPKGGAVVCPAVEVLPEARNAGQGYWTQERDLAVLETKGRYSKIGKLAEAWGIPTSRIVARWHIVRVG